MRSLVIEDDVADQIFVAFADPKWLQVDIAPDGGRQKSWLGGNYTAIVIDLGSARR